MLIIDILNRWAARRRLGKAALRNGTLIAAIVALAGCFGNDVAEEAVGEQDAHRVFNEAVALANSGQHSDAARRFQEVDKIAPYSDLAKRSMVMQAYTNFTIGQYQEAINAANRFITLYPGNKDAAYAQYIIGRSYFAQIPSIVQDQEITEKTVVSMSELIRKYPDSEYVQDAKEKILIAQDQLAGKEMEVGRFYQSRHNHSGAINRFKTVVTNFQQTRHVEEALARLVESYFTLGVVEEARTAAAVLGHNFPDSRWYRNAYELLQKNGYDPKENKSSWISRAFDVVKLL